MMNSFRLMWLPFVLAFVAKGVALNVMAQPPTSQIRIAYQPGLELETVELPVRGSKSTGFQVAVSSADMRLFGDIPLQIVVSADSASFPADRTILVRIAPQLRSTQPPGNDSTYEIPMLLSEGKSAVAETVYLPKWSIGGEFEVSVLEDRRPIDGYRIRFAGGQLQSFQAEEVWWEAAGQRFGWMIEDAKDKPDATTFIVSLAPELMNIHELSSSQPGFAFAGMWRQFRAVPIGGLPTDWRGFDAVDVWIAESQTLRSLMKKHPAVANALRNYIRCGGTLWILGAGADNEFASLFTVPTVSSNETDLQIAATVSSAMQPIDYDFARASTYQSTASFRGYLRQQSASQSGNRARIYPAQPQNTDLIFNNNLLWIQHRELDGEETPLQTSDFDFHDVALGRVVVCKLTDAVPGSPQQWRAMAGLTAEDMSETLRRGIDPCFGDRRYWDWIIPDVAQPPVYTFIGLLVAFVVVVGPLAYRKLTKIGRGYLMMFVAPLLALVTTLTMFAYGLVADGLSTRGRVREVTWVGDKSGTGARYTRATYFAGIRPSAGIRFPGNAIVMPYHLPTVSSWRQAGDREHTMIGTIRLEDDQIALDSGFLPSRQQQQFVTYRPVENVGVLQIEAASSNAVPTLISSMPTELRQGVVCDQDGHYFSFDKLPPVSKTRLVPIEKKVAAGLLSELYAIQRPIAPPAISSGRRVGDSLIDMVTQLDNRFMQRTSIANRLATGESATEFWIRMHLQIGSELPAGMFVAIADVSADCIAADSTVLVESVHYVIGALQ